jgi:hypothetical protein
VRRLKPFRGVKPTPISSPGLLLVGKVYAIVHLLLRATSTRMRLIIAAAFFASARALAADTLETARLTYSAAPRLSSRCPDADSFRNQVAARLGYQAFTEEGLHAVTVSVSESRTGVRAHAEVLRQGQTVPGVRELEGSVEKCEALLAALATAVAISLDPVRSMAPPPVAMSVPAPAPATPSLQPAPPQVQQAPPAAPIEPKVPLRLFGALDAAFTIGILPSASVGGDVGVGVRRGDASIELMGRAETTPSATTVASGDRLEASAFSALLSPCGIFHELSVCALGRFGALQGRAPDVAKPSLGTSLFATVGARVGYTLWISPVFGLRAMAAAEFPLIRTLLVVNQTQVWTAPLATASLQIGIVISAP